MSIRREVQKAVSSECRENLIARCIDGTAEVFNFVERFGFLGTGGLVQVITAEATGFVGREVKRQLI